MRGKGSGLREKAKEYRADAEGFGRPGAELRKARKADPPGDMGGGGPLGSAEEDDRRLDEG